MPNQLEFIGALVGIAKLGAVAVPVNGRFRVHELDYVISHADVRVLLTAAGPEGTVDYPRLVAEVFPEIADADPAELRLADAPGGSDKSWTWAASSPVPHPLAVRGRRGGRPAVRGPAAPGASPASATSRC